MARPCFTKDGLRTCTKCGIEKPATSEFFYADNRAPDGCASWCRDCRKTHYETQKEDSDWIESRNAQARESYHKDLEASRERSRETSKRNYDKDPERARERSRNYAQNNPEYVFAQSLKRNHNITLEQYYAMWEAQEGICAVPGCGSDNGDKRLEVDHDHRCCPSNRSCGQCVRGLLCSGCNVALGRIYDNPVVAIGLAEYLLEVGFSDND